VGILKGLVGSNSLLVLSSISLDLSIEGSGISMFGLEVLARGGDCINSSSLLIDPLVECLSLVSKGNTEGLVLFLGGELSGELALARLNEGLEGSPLAGEVRVGEFGVGVLSSSEGTDLLSKGSNGLILAGLLSNGVEELIEGRLELLDSLNGLDDDGSVRTSSAESNQMLN